MTTTLFQKQISNDCKVYPKFSFNTKAGQLKQEAKTILRRSCLFKIIEETFKLWKRSFHIEENFKLRKGDFIKNDWTQI